MSCIVCIVSCDFTIHATCLLALIAYKYDSYSNMVWIMTLQNNLIHLFKCCKCSNDKLNIIWTLLIMSRFSCFSCMIDIMLKFLFFTNVFISSFCVHCCFIFATHMIIIVFFEMWYFHIHFLNKFIIHQLINLMMEWILQHVN
jgi:hypothetical protein